MHEFEEGQLDALRAVTGDWVIGNFQPPPRYSRHVAVKWGVHDAHTLASKRWAACVTATTLSILIRGKFQMEFVGVPEHSGRYVVSMTVPGQFVLLGPGIAHKSESLADGTQFLTIRWPSLGKEDTITFESDVPPSLEDLDRATR